MGCESGAELGLGVPRGRVAPQLRELRTLWRSVRNLRDTILRDGDRIQDVMHDLLARDFVRIRLKRRDDAVAQHVERDALDVLRRHITAALQEGVSLAGEGKIDGRARAGTE